MMSTMATAAISAAALLAGIVLGSALRNREWLKQKQVEIYDEFFVQTNRFVDVVLDMRNHLRAHPGRVFDIHDPTPDAATARTAELHNTVSAVGWDYLASRHRIDLVGTDAITKAADAVDVSRNHFLDLLKNDPYDDDKWQAAGTDWVAAAAGFGRAARRQVRGWHRQLLRRSSDPPAVVESP